LKEFAVFVSHDRERFAFAGWPIGGNEAKGRLGENGEHGVVPEQPEGLQKVVDPATKKAALKGAA
jgi:hypothetical protein